MVISDLPSPRSMRESSPEDTVATPPIAHGAQSPASLAIAQNIPTDTFPIFSLGDIFIKTNQARTAKQWQLHSTVLAWHSSWFARSIQEASTTDQTTKWYFYVLEEVDGQLKLTRQTAEGGRPNIARPQNDNVPDSVIVKVEDNDDGATHEPAIEVYNKVFGAFYNIPPPIIATNIKLATSQAEETTKVAQDLGCLHLISSHIGNVLLQYRQSLYKAILADPPRYLLLSLALKNAFIYTESLIHIIGAYPCWPWPTKSSTLPEEIRRLIAKKSHELAMEVLRVERELLLLTITTQRGEPYNCDTTSQFDTWFIVQLFRDTLTNAFRQHDASKPSLKRGSLFRKIRAGGSRYMAYEDVRRMVQRVMPSAVETLEEDLGILKEFASEIVKEMTRNEASLDVEHNKVGWLTCVTIGKEDVPWRVGGESDG